jgi:YihY family inner membrane protein
VIVVTHIREYLAGFPELVRLAARRFLKIDGALFAAATAHYAFFSLFPLIVLFVTLASTFIDRDRATSSILAYIETYLPIGAARKTYIFDIVSDVMKGRGPASGIALLVLAWSSVSVFTTLINAVNSAWGAEAHHWWRLPLKSVMFLIIIAMAGAVGIAAPIVFRATAQYVLMGNDFDSWVYSVIMFCLRFLVTFVCLALFYKLAPRQRTGWSQVWPSALVAALLIQFSENLFAIYLANFATLSAVYGAFGGVIALLLWIYVSGCIFIFGACLSAAQTERSIAADQGEDAHGFYQNY